MPTAMDIARAECAKFPDMPSRSIARRLHEAEPLFFKSIDMARCAVRDARGVKGPQSRMTAARVAPELIRPAGISGDYLVTLPPGQRQGHEPFKLPLPAKVLVVSDLHVPFHDPDAIACAIQTGKKEGCDTVYINGDGLDFYQLSRFVKDPRERKPSHEVKVMHEIMGEFEKAFPKRYYKQGNHDERWTIALFQAAPLFADFEEVHFKSIMKFEKRGWGHIESKQLAEFGLLHVVHGHEAARGLTAAVNPARGVWLKIKATCLVGHWHQTSSHTEMMPLDKRIVASWSTGCLCHLTPEFCPINNWCHGFAIVDVAADGTFDVRNYRLVNGKPRLA